MEKLIIASMYENAGKTSIIVGLAKALDKKFGYMKPLGDRLLYHKKQLWDYDASFITDLFDITDNPVDVSLGFDHTKLRYMYPDEESTKKKLQEAISHREPDKDLIFIEASKDLLTGISVYLDPISVAKHVEGKLIIVVSGDEDTILDEVIFIKNQIDLSGVNFAGIIINKLRDIENFEFSYRSLITDMGVEILGVIPYVAELTRFSVDYLSEKLFASVIAGEDGLDNIVHHIFVGDTTADTALRNPSLKKKNFLTITSGDRTDMILAALENDTIGIVITNHIMPPENIITKATEKDIPLLLVPTETYEVAKQIDTMLPPLTEHDTEKINLLAQLMKQIKI